MKVLRGDPPYYQVIKLTPSKPLDIASKLIYTSGYDYESGCEYVNRPGRKLLPSSETNSTEVVETSTTFTVCKNSRRFKSARERWWFIAVSNCNGSKVCGLLILELLNCIYIKFRCKCSYGTILDGFN